MEKIDKTLAKKIMDEEEVAVSPKFLAQIQKLALEHIKSAKNSTHLTVSPPRFGKDCYITQ